MRTALSGAAARELEPLPEGPAPALALPCDLGRPVHLGVLGEVEASRLGRRGPRSVSQILATHPWIPRRQAAGPEALVVAADELLDLGCEVMVVAGGDAAVHAALTAVLRRGERGRPLLALVDWGRSGAAAREVGAIADMDGLERLLVDARAGALSGEVRALPTLEARLDGLAGSLFGLSVEASAPGLGRAAGLIGPAPPVAALRLAARAWLGAAGRSGVAVRMRADGWRSEASLLALAATALGPASIARRAISRGRPALAAAPPGVRLGVLAGAGPTRLGGGGRGASGALARSALPFGLELWRGSPGRLDLELEGDLAIDGVRRRADRGRRWLVGRGPAAFFLRPRPGRAEGGRRHPG